MMIGELHPCEVEGAKYWFRTPLARDLSRMRRVLTREGIRLPLPEEFQAASLAGVVALAQAAGDVEEGNRQVAVLERWYELLVPISEDEIEEPDAEARAAELERRRQERQEEMQAVIAEVGAIEATLSRHWPPYAELLADRTYYNEILSIEIVRLLLIKVGDVKQPRDSEDMLAPGAYEQLPMAARPALSTFAMQLLAPSEDERKN